MSILIKLSLLFFLMDTFIRKPFHLEKLLDISDKMAIPIAPYFWIPVLYGVAIVILSISLMIYETSKRSGR